MRYVDPYYAFDPFTQLVSRCTNSSTKDTKVTTDSVLLKILRLRQTLLIIIIIIIIILRTLGSSAIHRC